MCMPGRFSRVRSVTLWTVALQGPWTPCPAVKDRPSGGMGEITAEVCGAGAVPTATTLQRKEQGWCLVWKGDSGKAVGYPHSGHQRTAFQTRWCLRERHSPPPTRHGGRRKSCSFPPCNTTGLSFCLNPRFPSHCPSCSCWGLGERKKVPVCLGS